MLKKLTSRSLLTHVFFITLFLVVPTLAFVRPPGEPFLAITRVFIQDTTANFVLLCFFYLNYYILIQKFFFTHKYIRYIFYVVLFLSLALTLPFLAGKYFPEGNHHLPPFDGQGPPDHFPPSAPGSIVTFVFDEFRRHLSLFFSAIFFSFLLRTREHVSLLKEEKLNAELSSLKAQINPHFLFNTLNSIYALSVKKDDRASEAIINLSGLMRYVTKDANDYQIPLNKEIEYISNYVELQKARLGNTAKINFECTGTSGNKKIAPLIIITYIENAFKYGVNPDVDDCVIDINLQITAEGIKLLVFNKKVQHTALLESTGIGMSNTGERLKHLYPGKHSLVVNENDETYSIMLTIELI
jgi:hypothetical protein